MPDKTPVVILGAGGYAAIIHEILSARPDVDILGCTDKALGVSERALDEGVSLRILGDDDILPELAEQHPGLHAVFALGPELMDVRARLIGALEREGIPPLTAVHPSAAVSSMAALGEGTVVREGAVVSAGVRTGPCCLVNLGASLDHDAQLATSVYIGQGAQISSHARIIGGAFVNTDVPEKAVMIGVPARLVRYLD